MNARSVGILAVLAVLAVAAAWWLGSERREPPVTGVGEPLLAGLGERLERLKEFRLTGGSGATVTLRREDGGFRVVERHGFPADIGKLRQYLLRLAEARRLEPKTANPERHAELGVEDPAKEDAASTLLTLVFEDGELAVVVGRYNGQGAGTFVRLPGDDQSWLVAGDLTLEREPTRWLARELIDLPSGKVRRLELRRPDGETILAAKKSEQEANFTVENLPPGRELSGEWAPTGLAGLLSALQIEDVRPAAEQPVPEDALALNYETFDGRRFAMRLWKLADDQHFLSLSAELLPEAEVPAPADGGTEASAAKPAPEAGAAAEGSAAAVSAAPSRASGAPAEASAQAPAPAAEATASPSASASAGEGAASAGQAEAAPAEAAVPKPPSREQLAAEVERLNRLTSGWVFRIPAWKYSAVDKRMEDLLKPKEEAKAQEKPGS